jgi:hypothetical protein
MAIRFSGAFVAAQAVLNVGPTLIRHTSSAALFQHVISYELSQQHFPVPQTLYNS